MNAVQLEPLRHTRSRSLRPRRRSSARTDRTTSGSRAAPRTFPAHGRTSPRCAPPATSGGTGTGVGPRSRCRRPGCDRWRTCRSTRTAMPAESPSRGCAAGAHPAYPGPAEDATTKSHVWCPATAGYCVWTMGKSRSAAAASFLSSSSESLHHWRENDERPGVDRDRDKNQHGQHEADRDQYSAQRPGLGVVDLVARRYLLHVEGLPGATRCHTSSLTGYRSSGG